MRLIRRIIQELYIYLRDSSTGYTATHKSPSFYVLVLSIYVEELEFTSWAVENPLFYAAQFLLCFSD